METGTWVEADAVVLYLQTGGLLVELTIDVLQLVERS
jgi:hypothetical protein